MSDLGSTIDFQPSDERLLSPSATERLSGLLAGLDRLDPILALPDYPAMLEAGHEFAGDRGWEPVDSEWCFWPMIRS